MSLPKPYYEDPWCQIFHGDCREILPELPKVDLVLTDIPYGVVNRLSSGLRNLNKETADIETMPIGTLLSLIGNIAQSYYIWCATEQVSDLRASFSDAGLSTRLCIWEKTNPTPLNAQHLWLSSIECCIFAKKSGATFNCFYESPVWRGESAEENGHPTPKPEWLFSTLIQASSLINDTVLDPFMGSGTTLRAAKDLGRKSIGIEIEEKYCEIAVERLRQEVFAL